MTPTDAPLPTAERWLLLIHQLPAKPAYLRVKVWRRLQALGAVAVKNAVYALPASEQAQEDFEWLLREIGEGGGEAFDLRGAAGRRPLRPGGQGPVRPGPRRRLRGARQGGARPRRRRSATSRRAEQARRGAGPARAPEGAARPGRRDRLLRRQRARGGRGAARRPRGPAARGRAGRSPAGSRPTSLGELHGPDLGDAPGRPRRPHRLGLADPPLHRPGGPLQVRAGQGLRARAGRAALRHVRGRVHPRGRPLHLRGAAGARRAWTTRRSRAIAEIVHDIDLKDGKFGRPEAAGHRHPDRRASCAATGDDEERLARGGAVFDDLYAYFRKETADDPDERRSGERVATEPGRADAPARRPVRARRCGSGRGSRRSASAARPARSRSCTASWSRRSAGSARSGSCTRSTTACCCPGPEAQQLAVYIGWLLHRTAGGLVAGTLFVLPGYRRDHGR